MVRLLLLSALIAYGCKPVNNSNLQSLDNFSATQLINRNICMISPDAEPTSEDIALASRIKWVLTKKIPSQTQDRIRSAAILAITSIPLRMKKLFLDFKGDIIFTDAEDRCAIEVPGRKTRSSEACLEYGPAVVSYGDTKILKPNALALYLKPDINVAQHGLVLQFGYFFSTFFTRLINAPDSTPTSPHFLMSENELPKWPTIKRMLALAYTRDIVNSNGVFDLDKILSYYKIFGFKDPEQKEKAEQELASYLVAESFDSYYCNTWSGHDKNLAIDIGKGTKPLTSIKSLKNSHFVMRDIFPESFKIFKMIAKTYFPEDERRMPSSAALNLADTAPSSGPTLDSYMAQVGKYSGGTPPSSKSPDLFPLVSDQRANDFITSSKTEPFSMSDPTARHSPSGKSVQELTYTNPIFNRVGLASEISPNGDPTHDRLANQYKRTGHFNNTDPDDAAFARGTFVGLGNGVYNTVVGGTVGLGNMVYTAKVKPYADAFQRSLDTGSITQGYKSFDPNSGIREIQNGVTQQLGQIGKNYNQYKDAYSQDGNFSWGNQFQATARVTPIVGNIIQGYERERPDGTRIEGGEAGRMFGEGVFDATTIATSIPSATRKISSLASGTTNKVMRFKTPGSENISHSGGGVSAAGQIPDSDKILSKIESGIETKLQQEANATLNEGWTAMLSDTHRPDRKNFSRDGLRPDQVELFKQAESNYQATLRNISQLPAHQKPTQLIFGGDFFDAKATAGLPLGQRVKLISNQADQMARSASLPREKVKIIIGNHDGVTEKLANGQRVLNTAEAEAIKGALQRQGFDVIAGNADEVAILPNSRLPLGSGDTRAGHYPINNGENLRQAFPSDQSKLLYNQNILPGNVTTQIGADIHKFVYVRGQNWQSGGPLRTIQAPTLGGGVRPGDDRGFLAIPNNDFKDPIFFRVDQSGIAPATYNKIIDNRTNGDL